MVVLGHSVGTMTQDGPHVQGRTVASWGRNGDGGTHEMWLKIALVLMLYFVLT